MPMEIVGATKTSIFLAMPSAISSGHSASVPMKPVGPCCSVEPMGIRMPVDFFR